MPMPNDAELLRRYADSYSEEAFAELVRRHLPFVFNTALRRVGGDTHHAEEIAQAVFANLAKKADKLARHPALTGWLHTSTRYAAAELVRKEQRRQNREQEALSMPDDSTPTVDWGHLRPVIDEALDQLDERDRAAVLLRFFENQPLSQIGQTLSLSEDAARKRIDRALEKLQRLLARRGIASTGTALGLALANNIAVAAPTTLATSITSAVATGAATASSTTSLLSFLAMTKLQSGTLATLIVALAATAGSVSLGVVVHRQQAELSVAPGLAAARTEADNRQLAELREKLSNAEKARNSVRAELKKLADKKAKRAREEEDALHGPARMLSHRLMFQQSYRPLFEQLHLDKTTREKFIAILIEDDIADLAATLKVRKTTGEDDAPWEQREATWATTDKKIQELLGPEGHAAYREYLANRVSGKEISLALADAGCELTADDDTWLRHQWYTLICLPAENETAKGLPQDDGLNPNQLALLTQAGGRLSPQQVSALEKYLKDENTYDKARKERRK